MGEIDHDLLLGRLAVHFELLTEESLAAARAHHRRAATTLDLGAFLLAEDYLEPQDLQRLQRAREDYLRRKAESAGATPPASPPPTPSATRTSPTVPSPADTAPMTAVEDDGDDGDAGDAGDDRDDGAIEPASALPAAVDVAAVDVAPVDAAPAEVPPPLEVQPAAEAAGSGLLPYRPGVTLDELLRATVACGASDLHVHSGAPLKVRIAGVLRDAHSAPVEAADAERMIGGLLGDEQRERLARDAQVDFAFALPDVGRFRANAYRQRRGTDAVFRAIPARPPTLESLGLPFEIGSVATYHQGLVLFTGPAGCGKSSTMAAIIDLINRRRADHVVTVEDPIEYVFTSDRCVVNQRQVGAHTASFSRALRAVLREDPDVVVIGELRDLETISLALTAAETGHLVLGTLHTSGAIRTINRLLGVFPPDQQAQIRTMVSESLRAIISQRLVARADGEGRVPALEVLYANKAIANLIRDNKTFQLRSVMQTGAGAGMCLLDVSLGQLVRAGTVTLEEARRHAEEPARLAEPK